MSPTIAFSIKIYIKLGYFGIPRDKHYKFSIWRPWNLKRWHPETPSVAGQANGVVMSCLKLDKEISIKHHSGSSWSSFGSRFGVSIFEEQPHTSQNCGYPICKKNMETDESTTAVLFETPNIDEIWCFAHANLYSMAVLSTLQNKHLPEQWTNAIKWQRHPKVQHLSSSIWVWVNFGIRYIKNGADDLRHFSTVLKDWGPSQCSLPDFLIGLTISGRWFHPPKRFWDSVDPKSQIGFRSASMGLSVRTT